MSTDPAEQAALFHVEPDTRHGYLGQRRWTTNPAAQTPHARREDPATSHEAAASVRAITVTQDRILALLRTHGPQTDEAIAGLYQRRAELSGWPPVSPSGLRSRRAELVAQGRVAPAGRSKTAAGRACIIWKAAA